MKRYLSIAVISTAVLLTSCTAENLPEHAQPAPIVAEGDIGGQGGTIPPPPPPPPPGG